MQVQMRILPKYEMVSSSVVTNHDIQNTPFKASHHLPIHKIITWQKMGADISKFKRKNELKLSEVTHMSNIHVIQSSQSRKTYNKYAPFLERIRTAIYIGGSHRNKTAANNFRHSARHENNRHVAIFISFLIPPWTIWLIKFF